MLLDYNNYTRRKYACIFTPEFGFTFSYLGQTLNILIGTECLFISACHEDDNLGGGTLNSDSSTRIREYLESVWPNWEKVED